VVKVGFIGCGGMAGVHLDKLKQIEDVQIVGLCDIIEEKARVYNQKYGGNVYTDHRVMLDREKKCSFSRIQGFADRYTGK